MSNIYNSRVECTCKSVRSTRNADHERLDYRTFTRDQSFGIEKVFTLSKWLSAKFLSCQYSRKCFCSTQSKCSHFFHHRHEIDEDIGREPFYYPHTDVFTYDFTKNLLKILFYEKSYSSWKKYISQHLKESFKKASGRTKYLWEFNVQNEFLQSLQIDPSEVWYFTPV